MALRTEQIYVHTSQPTAAIMALRAYVETHGRRFIPHPEVRLDGVKQVLANLIGKKRSFWTYFERDWLVVWESVAETAFADPAVAQYLSKTLQCESIWLKVDEDYNIWAEQVFRNGDVVEEQFLPVTYFRDDAQKRDKARRQESSLQSGGLKTIHHNMGKPAAPGWSTSPCISSRRNRPLSPSR